MANRKVLIISLLVAAAGITFLVVRRSRSKKNSALLGSFIEALPKENTTVAQNAIADKAAEQIKGATDTYDVKEMIKGNPIIFDGKVYKDAKAATGVALKIASELFEAVSTKNPLYVGTDMNQFKNAFKRLGSKNALILTNAVYKARYSESLWQAIDGESKLYHGKGVHATIASVFMDLPKYDKIISDVLSSLK